MRDELRARSISVEEGTQAALDAAAKHDARLRTVIKLLCTRHEVRVVDALRSLATLYHALSKEFHGISGQVSVQEADFTAPGERLVLCALLEAYAVRYAYEAPEGTRSPSPYALLPADMAALGASWRYRGGGGGVVVGGGGLMAHQRRRKHVPKATPHQQARV